VSVLTGRRIVVTGAGRGLGRAQGAWHDEFVDPPG
jgi:hypothetical protein